MSHPPTCTAADNVDGHSHQSMMFRMNKAPFSQRVPYCAITLNAGTPECQQTPKEEAEPHPLRHPIRR